VIRVKNLSVAFDGPEVVKNVSFEIGDAMMGLVSEGARVTSGEIYYDDEVLLKAGTPRDNALYREYLGRRMSMVFQEPMTSLNPTMKVGKQVEEVLCLHEADLEERQEKKAESANRGMQFVTDSTDKTKGQGRKQRRERKEARKQKVLEALSSVGLKDVERVYDLYPHQLSGGMRQRVMIAMAVILHPGLIVADEPTTALDVTVQNQIIELLKKINQEQNNSLLFITHDLNLARRLCDRILVMQNGCIVEEGITEEIFQNPRGEYTRKLISAVPGRTGKKKKLRKESGKALVEVRDLSVFYRENANSLFGRTEKKCVAAETGIVGYSTM